MNLILWRHAEAEDMAPDLQRQLTLRGRKQATRMGHWLKQRLPERYQIVSSPATRTRQTADALSDCYEIDDLLAPHCDVADYIAACDWPSGPAQSFGTVVIVGHQPILGRFASLLLSGTETNWTIKKGAIWWLSTREREGNEQVILKAALTPEMIE